MQATVSQSISLAGISIQATLTRTAEGGLANQVDLAAGVAGTLSTRTDDDTGEVTLTEGHGITDGDKVDVYFSGGIRYGMTVGTVVGNVVPVDLGAGDNLPADDAAVVVCKQTVINIDFDGDDAELVAAHCTKRAHLSFLDSGDAVLKAQELVSGEPWFWAADSGIANPLTGNAIDEIRASNGETAAAVLKIAALVDNVT